MDRSNSTILDKIKSTLEQNTRGVQIGIYTVAGLGLAYAFHIVRPVSKFSRAIDIPKHFIKAKEPLVGQIVGYVSSPTSAKLLFDHKPLIKLPLWHSNKPPLKVQVLGVKPISDNMYVWLNSVAVGCKATVIPLKVDEEMLTSKITLHLPIYGIPKTSKKIVKNEDVDLGERLVELGLGVVTNNMDKYSSEYTWWTPWIAPSNYSTRLRQAQYKAIAHRAGHWQDVIPPSKLKPLYDYIKLLFTKSKPVNTS